MAKKKASKKKESKKSAVREDYGQSDVSVDRVIEDNRIEILDSIAQKLHDFNCGDLPRYSKRMDKLCVAVENVSQSMGKAIKVQDRKSDATAILKKKRQDIVDAM